MGAAGAHAFFLSATTLHINQTSSHMRIIRNSLFFSLLFSASIACFAAPASQESINTLLIVTKSEALVATMQAQMEQMMRQTLTQTLAGRKVTDEQVRVIEAASKQFSIVMKEELSWTNIKAMYVPIYQETFTQEEIDGLIAFYRSPTGAAFIDKMPLVMQKSTSIMQARMPQLMQKMQAVMQKAMAEAGVTK